ncbi:unnamed protein product, partial [Ixodes persulcatus]
MRGARGASTPQASEADPSRPELPGGARATFGGGHAERHQPAQTRVPELVGSVVPRAGPCAHRKTQAAHPPGSADRPPQGLEESRPDATQRQRECGGTLLSPFSHLLQGQRSARGRR